MSGERVKLDQPAALHQGHVAPAELQQSGVEDRLEGGREGAGEDREEEEEERMTVGRGHERVVAETLHCEAGGEDEGLDALGEEGVAAVENQEVGGAGEEEEEVDVDDEGLGGREGGGEGPGEDGGEDGENYLDEALPGEVREESVERRRWQPSQVVPLPPGLLDPAGETDRPPPEAQDQEVQPGQEEGGEGEEDLDLVTVLTGGYEGAVDTAPLARHSSGYSCTSSLLAYGRLKSLLWSARHV